MNISSVFKVLQKIFLIHRITENAGYGIVFFISTNAMHFICLKVNVAASVTDICMCLWIGKVDLNVYDLCTSTDHIHL